MNRFIPWLVLALAVPRGEAASNGMRVDVDARELHRQLLHAKLEIPATTGEMTLLYPKWIPGTHAPGGPIANVAGLRVETPDGPPIPWRRDDADPFQIHCRVPADTKTIIARLDYICNQPNANSTGVDSFGNSKIGILNWNTCLLYPADSSIDALQVEGRVQLPKDWRCGTALQPQSTNEGLVAFKPETLRKFIDCPIICGESFRTIDLSAKDSAQAYLHITSEAASAIQLEEKLIAQYRKLVKETVLLFGATHFPAYHFLVVCSDQVPHSGVEHHACSMNMVNERELVDEKKRKNWPAYLLPHEFVHSWCGKYRRPLGMVTTNFNTVEQTSLLWVYEGLTQYLGEVLTVRSGLLTTNEYLPWLAAKIDGLMHQEGRRWRSLEDTAISSHLLRAASTSWGNLRRNQDYYDEGMLLWLEADAIIRERTDGHASLDDFCKKFMGPNLPQVLIHPYELKDVIKTLNEVVAYDWDKFIQDRVNLPLESLDLDLVTRLGYRLSYADKPSEFLTDREKERRVISVSDSLGLALTEEGRITSVNSGMPGDKAGLAPWMTVWGINGKRFTSQRLKDAVAESISHPKIDFLILEADTFRTVTVNYGDGPKYMELVRAPGKADILARILASGAENAK